MIDSRPPRACGNGLFLWFAKPISVHDEFANMTQHVEELLLRKGFATDESQGLDPRFD